MSARPICPKCGGAGGVIVPIPGDLPTVGPCKTCAPTTDPSKVNALRKLTEAAEAIGWACISSTAGLVLLHPTQPGEVTLYAGRVSIRGQFGVPVELMALLLEAAR